MPATPIYGLPFEKPGDQPGISLHGGQAGGADILAEAVETELGRVDTTTADLQTQITGLQGEIAALRDGTDGLGWIFIDKGQHTGGNFTIDVTAGGKFDPAEFSLIRWHARFDLDAAGGSHVRCRINGDDTAGLHRTGSLVYDAAGSLDITDHIVGTQWKLAWGSTISVSTLMMQIWHTAVNPGLLSYQCYGTRHSDDPSVHRWNVSWGSLTAARTLSSLRIFAATAADGGLDQFTDIWWWLEGLRTDLPA